MKTATINIKIDEKTKESAMKLARELGLSLSSVLTGYLKTFVKNRKVTFNANPQEIPNEKFAMILRDAENEEDDSPVFDSAKDAIVWLDNESKKYEKNKSKI